MRVIDLLNKIANGEEVPEKIRYKGDCWHLNQKYTNRLPYYSNGYSKDNLFTGEEEEYFSHSLNDEVEIIEEDKKIETINNFTSNVGAVDENNIEEYIHKLFEQELILYLKINQIIDYINKGD